MVAKSPTSTLENFRREWEAELKKVTGSSNVNSVLNLSSASPASLANPYPNPTSMAGAVSRSNPTSPLDESGGMSQHPFAAAAPRKLVEVGPESPGQDSGVNISGVPEVGTIEEQARKWFLQGIGLERHGDLYDAVRCYRRAIQLVPDIEYRIGSGAVVNTKQQDKSESSSDESTDEDEDEVVDDEESKNVNIDAEVDDDEPLMKRFLKIIEKNGWQFFEKVSKTDQPHLGDLPVEVVSYILRFVYIYFLNISFMS